MIGYEYAAIHPVVQEASGNLVLLVNKFGKCLGGSHPRLYEETYKASFSVDHVSIDATIEDFCSIEALGIKSSPACGNCRCGKCPIGSHNYLLKDERELKQIENGLRLEEGTWIVPYPWKRDPRQLPDNKVMALAVLKSTEKRLLKNREYAKVYKE